MDDSKNMISYDIQMTSNTNQVWIFLKTSRYGSHMWTISRVVPISIFFIILPDPVLIFHWRNMVTIRSEVLDGVSAVGHVQISLHDGFPEEMGNPPWVDQEIGNSTLSEQLSQGKKEVKVTLSLFLPLHFDRCLSLLSLWTWERGLHHLPANYGLRKHEDRVPAFDK